MQTYHKLNHKLKEDKRGQIVGIVIVVGLIFLALIVGFLMVVGSAVTNWVADEVVPEFQGIGSLGIGEANLTEVAEYTINPANNLIQSLTWFTGVIYVLMLVGCLGVSYMIRDSPNKWLVGFFFLCMLILVLGSVFISNMYEDFYNGSDSFSLILREHTILSFMILYSPMINTILGFVAGFILFSGRGEESYV